MMAAGLQADPGHSLLLSPPQQDNNPEECPVCLTLFDDDAGLRPRNLPCGHTFCTTCVNGIRKQDQVTCPTCRAIHEVPAAGQFPISYTLEAFMMRFRDTSAAPPSWVATQDATQAKQNSKTSLSREMCYMLQEWEAKILTTITACQDVQSQLDQYNETLLGWHHHQHQLVDRLQAMIDQVRSATVFVRQEQSQVMFRKERMQQKEQQLTALLKPLNSINTEPRARKVIKYVDEYTNTAEQAMEASLVMFPGIDTVIAFRKVKDAGRKAIQTLEASVPANVPPGIITNRLHTLLTQTLTAEDIRSLRQPVRTLLHHDQVVMVCQSEPRRRHARISLEKDKLYLHFLKNQPPPLGAATVQMDKMMPAALPCVVFLDVAWPGSSPRRVLISLSSNTPRGRQFQMLCAGQRGPSYAHTRLFAVSNKGEPGEWVLGGDYEQNNGKGGAALLPDLDQGQYRRSARPGDVWGPWLGSARYGAQFAINTTKRSDGYSFDGVFGDVVSGLDAVVEAAQQIDIKEVTVVDCGVVVWGKSSASPASL